MTGPPTFVTRKTGMAAPTLTFRRRVRSPWPAAERIYEALERRSPARLFGMTAGEPPVVESVISFRAPVTSPSPKSPNHRRGKPDAVLLIFPAVLILTTGTRSHLLVGRRAASAGHN